MNRFLSEQEQLQEWFYEFVNSPLYITIDMNLDQWTEVYCVCVEGSEWETVPKEIREKILGWFRENPRMDKRK